MYMKRTNTEDDSAYFFFSFNANITKDVRRRVRSKVVEGKGPGINQIVPAFDRLCVSNRGFDALLMPALKLRPSLNYAKLKTKELVMIKHQKQQN